MPSSTRWRAEPPLVPTDFGDWHAINSLLMAYSENLDLGRWAEVAALFEHSTYRVHHAGTDQVSEYSGADAVLGFCQQTRLYPDGTPRTKHCITNVDIHVDGDDARSSCYVTVFQQTDVLPLQPIASGRYVDRFERAAGTWRFTDRLITGFLLGDRSQHVPWHEGTPD